MSRITSCTSQVDSCGWIKTNQQQIERHPAWHKSVDAKQAEALLKGNASFTYLLRKGEEERSYFITFVKKDQVIKHQRFTLEHSQEPGLKGWYYRNGMGYSGGPTEISSVDLEDLIPQMMHCALEECKIMGEDQA